MLSYQMAKSSYDNITRPIRKRSAVTGTLVGVRLQAGQIKAFAVTAKNRLPSLPDIPTVDEEGLKGLYVNIWYGLWAPKGTPKDIIVKLNAAAVKAMADPVVKQRFTDLGLDTPSPDQQSAQALGMLQKAEIEKWWPIIKAAGIKAE